VAQVTRIQPGAARALFAAAVVPSSSSWAVSWWEGLGGGPVVPGVGGAVYPDAAALAADLEALLARPHPKREGAALACATFGRDGDAAAGVVPRRGGDVSVWTAVQLDAEPKDGRTPPDLAAAWAVLAGLGVAVVAHPSPSSSHRGERYRAWVRVADHEGRGRRGVGPWAQLGARVLLKVLDALALGPFDPAPTTPQSVGYVHPVPAVGPRPPGTARHVEGGAVDLEALARAAVAAGIVPHPRERTKPDGGWDGAALLDLFTAAGLVRGRPDHRGWIPVECPRAHEHSGPSGATAAAFHPGHGRAKCLHSHTLGTRAMVDAAMGQLPSEAAARITPTLRPHDADRPSVRARARLAAGAAPPTVPVDAAGEAVVSAAVSAVREGGAVLVRATVGAGKSHAVPAIVAALAPPPVHVDRPEAPPAMGLSAASAVVMAPTREGRVDLAEKVGAHGGGKLLLPVFYSPVAEHLRADGTPECKHHAAALALQSSGASVRRSLCRPTEETACERHGSCPAEQPWRTLDGGTPDPLDPRPLVAVLTHHAPAPPARVDAPLIVDEACRWPYDAEPLAPATLAAAKRYAAWLSPRLGGAVAVALVRALQHRWGDGIATTPPEDRAALLEGLAVDIAASHDTSHRALASLAREAHPDAPDATAAILAAFAGGLPRQARGLAPRSRRWPTMPGGRGAAPRQEGLRAVRACGRGTHAAEPTRADDDAPRDTALPCRPTRRTDGTTSAVHNVVVGDAADVTRLVVAHARATSRAMLGPGGLPRWGEIAPALSAVAQAVTAWRAEHLEGPCPVAVCSRQPIARAIRAWWSVGDDRSPEALNAAADAEAGRWGDAAHWGRLLRAALRGLAADEAAAAALEALRAVPGASLEGATWWGGVESRGSNALSGARVFVAVGDPWPTPAEAALRAAVTGTTVDAALEALADEAAEQLYGRARHVRRGDAVLMIHAGERPPSTWRQHGDNAARVVSAAELVSLDAARAALAADRTEPNRNHPGPRPLGVGSAGAGADSSRDASGRGVEGARPGCTRGRRGTHRAPMDSGRPGTRRASRRHPRRPRRGGSNGADGRCRSSSAGAARGAGRGRCLVRPRPVARRRPQGPVAPRRPRGRRSPRSRGAGADRPRRPGGWVGLRRDLLSRRGTPAGTRGRPPPQRARMG
jgi:hypothetical protein